MSSPSRAPTVAHVDPERGFSGGEVQVFLLLEGLRAAGLRNVLCCQPGSACEAQGRARGFDVRTVAMPNDAHLPAVVRLARVFRDERVDLVHLHTGRANALGGLAARLARRPAITTRRMDAPVRRHPFNRWLYGSLVRRAVAISPAVAQQLRAGGVPEDKIAVVPSAVDPAALRPSRERGELRAALGLDDDVVALLVLAGLSRRKGLDVLLDALARLGADGCGRDATRGGEPDAGGSGRSDAGGRSGVAPHRRWRLLVAGDGAERAALQARARELDLTGCVDFLGRRDDAADLLAACDVLCMPSRREGLGIAALEAMAAGRPVVGSRVGGLADAVVHERTGLLVPPDDAAALAAAIARVVADDELRARLGAAGPQRIAEGFRSDQMVSAYLALYREVLGAER